MTNFFDLKQGGIDPVLNRKIEVLIVKTNDYIVYLDEAMEAQWATNVRCPDYSGRVCSRVTQLEGMSGFITNSKQLRSIRCLIAEGLACLLDGTPESEINSLLNEAEMQIKLKNRECSRFWYFIAALIASSVFMIVCLAIILLKSRIPSSISITAFEISTTALFGAIGALGSVCIRSESLRLDANAGFSLHVLEACARVFIGVIASLLFVLFVKGGFLLHLLADSKCHLALLWALGIISGASERVFAGFIKKGEDVLLEAEKSN